MILLTTKSSITRTVWRIERIKLHSAQSRSCSMLADLLIQILGAGNLSPAPDSVTESGNIFCLCNSNLYNSKLYVRPRGDACIVYSVYGRDLNLPILISSSISVTSLFSVLEKSSDSLDTLSSSGRVPPAPSCRGEGVYILAK